MGSDRARAGARTSSAAAETARAVNRVPAPMKMIVALKPDGGSDAVPVSRPLAAVTGCNLHSAGSGWHRGGGGGTGGRASRGGSGRGVSCEPRAGRADGRT